VSLDTQKTYKVKGFQGVACKFVGYPQRWESDDYAYGHGEWVDDTDSGCVLVVMVGDDHKHRVPETDCTPIDDLDYCGVCGQIGCAHDGRDRT